MASGSIVTTFKRSDNWHKLARALDATNMRPALEAAVRKEMQRFGVVLQAKVREHVRQGVTPKNSGLTILIKRSSKPLVDTGDLLAGVTSHMEAWNKLYVGVLRTDPAYNLARVIHDGAAITVTDRMRMMFRYLWLAGQGRMNPGDLTGRAAELWARAPGAFWRPLKEDTTVIVIPARRFVADVVESHGTKTSFGIAMSRAVKEAYASLFPFARARR